MKTTKENALGYAASITTGSIADKELFLIVELNNSFEIFEKKNDMDDEFISSMDGLFSKTQAKEIIKAGNPLVKFKEI